MANIVDRIVALQNEGETYRTTWDYVVSQLTPEQMAILNGATEEELSDLREGILTPRTERFGDFNGVITDLFDNNVHRFVDCEE
jgi:hypothetical protein